MKVAQGLASSLDNNCFRIVGGSGTPTQLLPISYVRSIPRLSVVDDNTSKESLVKDVHAEDGLDAIATEFRLQPTLDILVKPSSEGSATTMVPSYVIAGLQQVQPDTNGQTQFFLAQQWVSFNWAATQPNFRLVVYQGSSDGTDERLALVPATRLQQIWEQLAQILANDNVKTDDSGFRILSFPIGDVLEIPMTDITNADTMITCLATAEPSGRELLSLERDLLEMTVTTRLQVPLSELSS